jgi:hypothetical protein
MKPEFSLACLPILLLVKAYLMKSKWIEPVPVPD